MPIKHVIHRVIRSLLPALCAGAIAHLPRTANAGETVTVRLATGRSFTAEVDGLTNADQLWLKSARGSATIRRPIDWDRVVAVDVGDRLVSAAEFRQRIVPPGSELPETIPLDSDGDAASPSHHAPSAAESLQLTSGNADSAVLPAVQSLYIDTYVANWDGDVEVDGLVLQVYPLDSTGYIVPLYGSLHVELIGQVHATRTRGEPFQLLARWTRRVTPNELGPFSPGLHLPFQATHPEFDGDLPSYGVVHARLSVPGVGVFEDSAAAVRIRPYSAVRDTREQLRGSRFFPTERTGRGHRIATPLIP